MYKILSALKESGQICEVHYNTRSFPGFDVGQVFDYDDDFLLLWVFTSLGESNGLRVVCLDDVCMIQTDTKYTEKINILILQQKPKEERPDLGGDDILHGALDYAMENDKICTAWLCGDGGEVCGKIAALDDGLVTWEIIDVYGNSNGAAYTMEDDIDALSIESRNEMSVKRLKLR